MNRGGGGPGPESTPADLGRRRSEALAARGALAPPERARLAEAVAGRVVSADWYEQSTTIGLYAPIGGELDPSIIGRHACQRSCSTWYPIVADDGPMRFRRWDGITALEPGPFGIAIPPSNQECEGADLDVVIVPLVLFGPAGLRVGRGRGHYDRTFANRSISGRPRVLCGLAYDFQEAADLVAQPWDVPLDVVITPTRTIRW